MFSNIGSDANIDWATLAQQWIQRNTKGNDTMEAPPPPNISQSFRAKNYGFDEKGEADMDMDDDELPPPAPKMIPYNSIGDANMLQFSTGDVDSDPTASWNTWMNPPNPNLPQQLSKSNPTAHIPSLMKMTVPNPNDVTKIQENSIQENTCTTIDAAKRKVLPAWIREGLEKMEREKQRQLERQQQWKERNDEKPLLTASTLQKVASNITVKDHVVKSVESGDSSGNEQEDDDLPYKFKNTNKSKHIGNVEPTTAASSGVHNDDDDADASALYVGKSYEQRLADLMILVRRTLTELLLEVTNDEIAQIAKETLNSSKLKASSAQVIRKSALSSITNRLGLAAYSSSGDESNSDDNSVPSDNEASRDGYRRLGTSMATDEDSEEEIKAKLRVRRRAFAKTTEEIEECVSKNAAREEQKLHYYKQKEQLNKQTHENEDEKKDVLTEVSTATFGGIGKNNNARDFGETTTESKLQQPNGKKSKERSSRRGERTTRFSDNKDAKNLGAVTATYLSHMNPTAAITAISPIAANAMNVFQISPSNSVGLNDVNTNLHNLYTPTTAAAAGISSMLSAAEAAIEKASKFKNSTSSRSAKSNDKRDREHRRSRRKDSHRHSSDDTDSSSTSNNSAGSTSSSNTSRGSKYSRASSNLTSKHKRSNHSSSSHYRSYRYEDQQSHHHKRHSSSSSSKYSSTHRHERSRNRSRSRSRSTRSSSSKRHHNRH